MKEVIEVLWNIFALRLVKGTILSLMQSVQCDHVHFFVSSKPKYSTSRLM